MLRAVIGGIAGLIAGAGFLALMSALKNMRAKPPVPFDPGSEFVAIFQPATTGEGITLLGLIIFGLVIGLFTAAIYAARSGAGKNLEQQQ